MTTLQRFCMIVALAIATGARPAGADIVTISPTGTTGPGGTITFSQIGPLDMTSANVNTDFTASGPIPVTATVSDTSPISIYGSDVNDSGQVWQSFTAAIVSGTATFQDPNDPYNPYSTYTDTPGWTVTLADQATVAIFSGGSIAPGGSLDTFLGLVVSDPSSPITISLSGSGVPEPSSGVLAVIAASLIGLVAVGRRRPRTATAILAAVAACSSTAAQAGGPQVVQAYQSAFTINKVGTIPGGATRPR